jgi:hypothetical protein
MAIILSKAKALRLSGLAGVSRLRDAGLLAGSVAAAE